MASRFSRFASRFKSLYTGRYAVVTNAVTAGSMGCAADGLAQFVENHAQAEKQWDKERSKNMTILATGFGAVFHYWYRFLDSKYPGKSIRTVATKVFIDIAVAPILYFLYIGSLNALKQMSLEENWFDFKTKFPVLLAADMICWPALQTFNFLVFPPHYRIIGLKFNDLVMGVLFSHLVNNSYSIKFFTDWFKSCVKSD